MTEAPRNSASSASIISVLFQVPPTRQTRQQETTRQKMEDPPKLGSGSWAATSKEQEQDSVILLVFVNTKSGGNQGKDLLPLFRGLLPTEQVIDLIGAGGPKAA